MKVNDEIDALEIMDIPPLRFLAAPRILALALMAPLIAFYCCIVGTVGGGLVGFNASSGGVLVEASGKSTISGGLFVMSGEITSSGTLFVQSPSVMMTSFVESPVSPPPR